jgi:hypothetical protein
LFEAYEDEVERVNPNGHGIVAAAVGDIDTATDGFSDNEWLYLPPTVFNRFAVTREINDESLAPRFSPSQRGWVLSGWVRSIQRLTPLRDVTRMIVRR